MLLWVILLIIYLYKITLLGANKFLFYELINEYNVTGDYQNYIVPAIYNGQKILYDLITNEIVVTLDSNVAFGGVISNPIGPTPTPTPTPGGSIDYTNSLNSIENSVNETNNLISNSNVSNTSIQQPNVPTDSTGVESGVNNIFTAIMNAFKNINTNQDIVFTIPNTNKNIVINGNYTYNMLHENGGDWVITIITTFWWYMISVYIVKDTLNIVDKIQEGKLDKVESTNIKGDML